MKSNGSTSKGWGILLSCGLEDDSYPHDQKILHLPLQKLNPNQYQPRKTFCPKELDELKNSIEKNGVLQPIVVRRIADDSYEIIAGERRFRASKLANKETIPAIIIDVDDATVASFSLIENIQRSQLSPMEEAVAYQRLMDEFGLTHQEVASSVGKPRSSISNALRLLSLPENIKNLINAKVIEAGHAKILVAVPVEQQQEIAKRIINENLTVRHTEELARSSKIPKANELRRYENKISEWTKKLSTKFKAKVVINNKGKGQIIIDFKTIDEADILISTLTDKPEI